MRFDRNRHEGKKSKTTLYELEAQGAVQPFTPNPDSTANAARNNHNEDAFYMMPSYSEARSLSISSIDDTTDPSERSSSTKEGKMQQQGQHRHHRASHCNVPAQLTDDADGSLREGEPVTLRSTSFLALLVNYAAMGFIAGALVTSVTPFMKGYLNVKSYQVSASSRLLTVAGSLKALIGVITDSFPIFGYRRKSYMFIGWVLCSLSLWITSLFEVPEPFFDPQTKKMQNPDAPRSGAKYTTFMLIASIAYTVAEVSMDAMMVEMAQREPLTTRGWTQVMVTIVANLFAVFARTFTGTVFNGKAYGGTFDWHMKFDMVMLLLAGVALIPIPIVWLYLHEEQSYPQLHLTERLAEIWKLVQRRSIWQVLLFQFIANFGWSFSSVSVVAMEVTWAKVKPVDRAVMGIFTGSFWCICAWFGYKYLLHASWTKTFVVMSLIILITDAVVIFCTTYNVIRAQYFWLLVRSLSSPATAVRYLLLVFPIVEIAELGHEGVTHGLVTGFMNLPAAFTASIYKAIDSYFDVSDKDMAMDSKHVRNQVATTFIIAYLFRLTSLAAVFFLPSQRTSALRLRFYGGYSKTSGTAVVVVFFLSVILGITTNLLSLFESTSCMRIAGGAGCSSK